MISGVRGAKGRQTPYLGDFFKNFWYPNAQGRLIQFPGDFLEI